ncbi:uncharacterized protein LOC118414354 [Branchiostoma floridae]|uniref:Uncharacterized protein LOC118414354 n=1 Tax=Branchiostoma floridae TaxID=7739 RepID=C3Y5S2_BRAFL|nr:uncharacterized protein LOC118414354 [Branchiostoma floridae]XP_035674257.1 uncharacterized protein LOC118414354 [Branchiostoma floridae]XP_035674258.1 uncharacterized protein LOC118414354 [Branchiostoma floridae]XP_035674259.1 uncharacterized protein LOC118414354 [Branchiostoma floridae]|eukprot:XP_002608309.1 hypothetical protein BRAFLDRAFT_89286 [Branchiostoma floridae]
MALKGCHPTTLRVVSFLCTFLTFSSILPVFLDVSDDSLYVPIATISPSGVPENTTKEVAVCWNWNMELDQDGRCPFSFLFAAVAISGTVILCSVLSNLARRCCDCYQGVSRRPCLRYLFQFSAFVGNLMTFLLLAAFVVLMLVFSFADEVSKQRLTDKILAKMYHIWFALVCLGTLLSFTATVLSGVESVQRRSSDWLEYSNSQLLMYHASLNYGDF